MIPPPDDGGPASRAGDEGRGPAFRVGDEDEGPRGRSLGRLALRRAAFGAALVLVVSSSALVLARLAPGDFATELVGEGASGEAKARERARLGLDRSLPATYVAWLRGAATLDFGTSFKFGRPVGPLVAERAANTALLALTALVVSSAAGLALGMFTARRRGALAALVRAASVAAVSSPPLVLAMVLAWIAVRTGWFPAGGMTTASMAEAGWAERALDVARHLVVPALALVVPLTAIFERLASRALAEALGAPHIMAAAARGIPARALRWRHALPNALAPVVAVQGVIAGSLLSGSFGVEIVTAWPGLGRLMYDALVSRDVNLVAGCAAVGAAFVALGVWVADVAVAWLDPRAGEAP
jgi:peptide/nickel transport system permease protein